MKSSYSRNLLIGFGLSLIILLGSSTLSFISIQALLDSHERVRHTNLILQNLERIISTITDAETGQRGYLLTNDIEFLEDYNGAQDAVKELLANVRELAQSPSQKSNLRDLEVLIRRRTDSLKKLIDNKDLDRDVTKAALKQGKAYMDEIRSLINKMHNNEETRLANRTAKVEQLSTFTPVFIIFALIFATLITVFFYIRLKGDFDKRVQLQKELEEKDVDINRRIEIIKGIAEQISAGDYSIRVKDEGKDGLGSLSLSLNKMAEFLENSFNLLSTKEWLQKGIAGVNDVMVGEKNVDRLTDHTIKFITAFTGSHIGAFYLLDQADVLKLSGSYAFKEEEKRTTIKLGEGLVGQCAVNGSEIVLNEMPSENISISYASGEIKPNHLALFPVYHENHLKGVIEIASLKPYSDHDIEFVKSACPTIGVAISSAQNHKKLQELLEETQAQSEELQTQHAELENLNAEMEAQTNRLQTSEEELKTQQEELRQTNSTLEERSKLLEDKNNIIVERNLEIQKKADELALSTQYKSEFLANMSHELRTPLNSILLLSRLLVENSDKNLSKEQIEYATVIQDSGNGLLDLINEILDLSKIESGKMDLEYADVQIADIADDLKALFKPIAKEKNLAFNIDIKEGTPDRMQTDKVRLEQIFKNLLSNALKFTQKGSVTFVAEPEGEEKIRFSVKDTGLGIPEDKQQLIFEAFQQADGSTRRKYGGTGLGLSISREIVRLLKGEFKLTSTPGKGSEFTVVLPLAKPEQNASPVKALDAEFAEESEEKTAATSKLLAPKIPAEIDDDRAAIKPGDNVVLIVEDDTHFASLLLDFSRKRGYKGIVVVRGDDVMPIASHYKPIAILLDIILPVKDGWSVMEALKSNPETRHIPVHIMSSLEVKRESLLKGAVDFINKPFALDQMQDIFSKLEKVLNDEKKKVVIIEEHAHHAKALSYFLDSYSVKSEIVKDVQTGAQSLQKEATDCVILDMGLPATNAYEVLEMVKKDPTMKDLPIIIFTGKRLSKTEESRIKKYADSIIVKTAHSYQRILDEVAIFLHLLEEPQQNSKIRTTERLGSLDGVLKDKKVLIADDDVRNIYALAKALEYHKMNVISAVDGEEALLQLEEHPDVNIVLMDMMMPEMDGYEATTKIRQDARFKHIPVLAVTAKAMMGDREKCITAGASDYISKPVDTDQLISLLRVWLYDRL